MTKRFLIFIFMITSHVICEIVQINEELKNGTEIEGLTKYLKTLILHQSTTVKIIEDNKLYHCLHIDPIRNYVIVKNRIDRESLCPGINKCIILLKFLISPSFQSISLNVEILDINDNAPQWPQKFKNINFIEFEGNKMESRNIHIDKAKDPDTNENSRINYYLKEKDGFSENKDFKIKFDSPTSRRLELIPIKVIDREKIALYEMVLIAEDNGYPKMTGSLELIVHILDKNDNGPVFGRTQYRNDGLPENVPIGSIVLTVTATDADAGNNGKIMYRIDDQKASEYFLIDENANLKVKKTIDYDAGIKSFQFSVLAIDEAPEEYRKTGECEVVVTIKDENDEKPEILVHVTKRDPLTNQPAIIENEVTQNFVLAHIEVKDPDFGGTDRVSCTINNNNKMRLEQISSSDNEFQIIAVASFDREERSMEKVDIFCEDQKRNTASKSIAFQILDTNDNSPKFTRVFHFRVTENSTNPNMFVGEIMAVDKDAESNSKIEFQIIGNEAEYFQIHSSGKMYTKQILDREEIEQFNLTILAKDGGIPPRTGTGLVIIDVDDINDWKPQFNSSLYEFNISENATIGTIIGTVTATDRDLPSKTKMKYKINPDNSNSFYPVFPFQMIRYNRGDLATKYLLDREKQSTFMFSVIAIDQGYPKEFTSTTTVKVNILDINDNYPIFRTSNKTVFTIQITDSIGHEIGTVEATDADFGENSDLTYQINQGNAYNYFSYNPQNQKLILLNTINRPGEHKLTITACDKGTPVKCSKPLWITIQAIRPQIITPNDPPNQETFSDSKTYIFIICVLVVLLLIIIILIICAIIFKNRICTQLNQNGHNNSDDMNTMEINNRKMNMQNEIMQRNTNMNSISPPDHMTTNHHRHPVPQALYIQRERQISSDYQSIEGGGSPPYNQIPPNLGWDTNSVQTAINDIQEPMYSVHRSTKDYYYPETQHHQYPLPPIAPYSYQAVPSPSYVMRMNNVPKRSQYNQETFPRNPSPKRYNSLLNVQSINSPNTETYMYKSLRKEKNKASFV